MVSRKSTAFRKDRTGVQPLMAVIAVLLVIGMVFGGMYYLYLSERNDDFHWAPGVSDDNAVGYIICHVIIVKDYGGVEFQIADDDAPYLVEGLPDGVVGFNDWMLNRAQAVSSDMRVTYTISSNGWEISETVALHQWDTVTASDGKDYLVSEPTSKPFIVKEGIYHIDIELERMVGGEWASLQSITTVIQAEAN